MGLEPTVSVGIISAKRDDRLQTDASLNPGNSGGPLLDMFGQVAGVVVSRVESTDTGRPVSGIGFAIPINSVKSGLRPIVKNITLGADERLIDAARRRAAEEHTTLNEQFRLWLEDYAGRKARAERAMAIIRELRRSLSTGGRKFTRDEMNER